MTSAGDAAARAAGEGQRAIHSRHTGSTRATGVCCSMTSLTSTAQASTPGRRQGRSRAAVAYQSTTRSPVAGSPVATLFTGVQCAVRPRRRAGPVPAGPPTSVPTVLHPVGELRPAVYWRRRLLVLLLLVAVLGGGGWLGWAAATGRLGAGAAGEAAAAPVAEPAPGRGLPSLASVQTPPGATTTALPPAPVGPAPRAGAARTPAL